MKKFILLLITAVFMLSACGTSIEILDTPDAEATPQPKPSPNITEISVEEYGDNGTTPSATTDNAAGEFYIEYDGEFSRRHFIFENYIAVGVAHEDFLSGFEHAYTAVSYFRAAEGERVYNIAVWAVDAPLKGFEVLFGESMFCGQTGDFYYVPGNPALMLDILEPGYAATIRNYRGGRCSFPTHGVTFLDSDGRRRYVGIVQDLHGYPSAPWLLVEFGREFSLEEGPGRATLPWAFPPCCTQPRYVEIWGTQFRTGITVFDDWGMGFGDDGILPLRYMPLLREVILMESDINDLTPLAGLTELQMLWFGNNDITDLTPLAELTNLRELRLCFNRISDLTPLANLQNLTTLHIRGNRYITDLTPLAGLTNLQYLQLCGNQISDVSPLSGLVNLESLLLERNNINDIAPLAAFGQDGLFICLLNNPIDDWSPLENIERVRGRPVS